MASTVMCNHSQPLPMAILVASIFPDLAGLLPPAQPAAYIYHHNRAFAIMILLSQLFHVATTGIASC
jgi:hypothetical protein